MHEGLIRWIYLSRALFSYYRLLGALFSTPELILSSNETVSA